jgi:hypothetical protein
MDLEILQRLSIPNKVSKSKEFYNYFCNNKQDDMWNKRWYFAKKIQKRILQERGFRNIQVFLEYRENRI